MMTHRRSNRLPCDREAQSILRWKEAPDSLYELVREKYANDARSILMQKNPVVRERERVKRMQV